MSKMTNSLLDAMSKTSPRVPSCSLKPQGAGFSLRGGPPSEANCYFDVAASLLK